MSAREPGEGGGCLESFEVADMVMQVAAHEQLVRIIAGPGGKANHLGVAKRILPILFGNRKKKIDVF